MPDTFSLHGFFFHFFFHFHGGITVLKTSVWTNTVVSQKTGEIESYKALEIGVQKRCTEHIPRNWNNLRWFLDTCLLWIDKTIATGKTYIWSRCDERLKTRVDLITPSKINEFYVFHVWRLAKDQSKIIKTKKICQTRLACTEIHFPFSIYAMKVLL